ncbi:MAG TPA: chemotaxis protein CheB [Gemmatimonadaceae bacterium]|nr:chemotaxis protein CheB [Gemmatimonadaceae bacterium]
MAGESFDPAVAQRADAQRAVAQRGDAQRGDARSAFDVIVIGASAGGLTALGMVLGDLPAQLPVAIAVVLHLSPVHPSHLVEVLARSSQLRVLWAKHGAPLVSGEITLAPPDQHLIVTPDARFDLIHSARVHYSRPSVDILFTSAATVFGARTLAVILTGNGVDGAAGVSAVHHAGGTVIAQDKESSEYFSMPREAIESGGVTFVLPLEEIGGAITRLVTLGRIS